MGREAAVMRMNDGSPTARRLTILPRRDAVLCDPERVGEEGDFSSPNGGAGLDAQAGTCAHDARSRSVIGRLYPCRSDNRGYDRVWASRDRGIMVLKILERLGDFRTVKGPDMITMEGLPDDGDDHENGEHEANPKEH